MTAKTKKQEILLTEAVTDDVFGKDDKVAAKIENPIVDVDSKVDDDKLAKLKAKLAKKEDKIVKKERSLNIGVIGSGQAGSRLAEQFYKLGVNAISLNTAAQDLKFIDIPESNKLLLEFGGPGSGGSAKSLEIGHGAAEQNADKILAMVNKHFADADIFMIALSMGGGSGAGSLSVLADILGTIGKPIICLAVLPMNSEDAISKSNSIETLHKITTMIKANKIANAFVIDNARIENIFANIGATEFFNVANKAIVAPIDMFNRLSMEPSATKSIDSTEFSRLLLDGGALSVYGEMTITDFAGETKIAEAVIENLGNNLLASGFDITQSKYAAFMVCANDATWQKIPAVAVNYANSLLSETAGQPLAVFRGTYVVPEMENDVVKVYSMFSGLGLPAERVEQLKKEAATLQAAVKAKDVQRNLSIDVNPEKSDAQSEIEKIKAKVATSKSPFGQFMNKGTIDRRGK